ncbi:hypothetical protein QL294_22150, partial [Bacillus subtilis]
CLWLGLSHRTASGLMAARPFWFKDNHCVKKLFLDVFYDSATGDLLFLTRHNDYPADSTPFYGLFKTSAFNYRKTHSCFL